MVPESEYSDITDSIVCSIKSEIERTQISAQRLLKGQKKAKDIGLTSGIIYSWISKKTKTAKQAHVELALKLWKSLPDAKYQVTMNKSHLANELQPIPREILFKFKKIQKLTGLLPSRIFNLRDDIPEYLNSNIVGQWLNVKGYKAHPTHVHWVMTACKEALDEATKTLKEHNKSKN